MRVLSLFDGVSCARVALGNRVTSYYAAEVDAQAMKVAQKNYPDTIQIGDVRKVKGEDYSNIDLLIGGSPCQDLSIAKKGRKGLEGDRSSLFWEYVRVLREVKPKWFILENVASMPKADRDIITREMGVEPILIDAALVSAQSRKRLFWTNIPGVAQPQDKGIVLKHILQPDTDVEECMYIRNKTFSMTAQTGRNPTKKLGYVGDHDHQAKRVYDDEGKLPALNAVCNSMVRLGHVGQSQGQAGRVYSTEGKSSTLSANGGGMGAKTGLYYIGHLDGGVRKGMEGQEDLSRAHRQCDRVYSVEGKAPTLSASETSGRTHVAVDPPHIRKLTPIECERLQGLPDNYTEGIARTNRYKCLGNAFNVDVIRHILSFLPE